MTLAASRYRKRSIALTMLLVWVFALLSGVANACLTEAHSELPHAGQHEPRDEHSAPAPLHAHAADRTQHDQQPEKAPCQKSCDESSQTLLKQLPKPATPDLQAVLAPSWEWAGDLHKPPPALTRAAAATVPPPSPPPRVQFSRLAL